MMWVLLLILYIHNNFGVRKDVFRLHNFVHDNVLSWERIILRFITLELLE